MNVIDKETAQAYKKYCESWEGDVDSISEFDTLGEGTAVILGSINGSIELHITSLTPADAAQLANNNDSITFEGIIEIDQETAEELAKTDAELSFSGVIADESAAKIIRSKNEWCTFIRKIDASFVEELKNTSENDDETEEPDAQLLLSDPGVVASIYEVCKQNELDPETTFLNKTLYFSAEALRAVAESHDPDEVLDFSWGFRYDEKKHPWGREHIEALTAFRGKEIHLNSKSETLTPENLALLCNYSLVLNSTDDFGDEYADAFRCWQGEQFVIENNAAISVAVADAIAHSNLSIFFGRESIISNAALSALCNSESLDFIDVVVPIIDTEEARHIAQFTGILVATNSNHITREGAVALQSAKAKIVPFAESGSVYADEETIALLEQLNGIEDVEPQWIGDEELKWQDRCRLILDIDTAQDEDFYEYDRYPRVTDDVIQEFASNPDSDISLSGLLVFGEGQVELLTQIKDERWLELSICRLSDSEAEALASIRKASIAFNKLTKVSAKGLAALSNRNAMTTFTYESIQSGAESGTASDDKAEEAEDEADSTIEAISFDLGRLRARIGTKQSILGGPEEILESIEQTIKENGLCPKYAMQEAWIGNFLVKCVNGDDTTEAKEKICELYWDK